MVNVIRVTFMLGMLVSSTFGCLDERPSVQRFQEAKKRRDVSAAEQQAATAKEKISLEEDVGIKEAKVASLEAELEDLKLDSASSIEQLKKLIEGNEAEQLVLETQIQAKTIESASKDKEIDAANVAINNVKASNNNLQNAIGRTRESYANCRATRAP